MYNKVFHNQVFIKRKKITFPIHTKPSMYAVIFSILLYSSDLLYQIFLYYWLHEMGA